MLSFQLSEVPSGGDTSELNGLIEEATGSPIYVTSVPELSSSQAALHRTVAGGGGLGGGEAFTTLSSGREPYLSQSPRRGGSDFRTSPVPRPGRRSSGEGILKSPGLTNGLRRTSTSGYVPSGTSSESSGVVVKSDAQSLVVIGGERHVLNGQYSTSSASAHEKTTVSPKPAFINRDTLM